MLRQSQDLRIKALKKIVILSTGAFNFDRRKNSSNIIALQSGPCKDMSFMSSKIEENCYLIFCTEINRFPSIDQNKIVYFTLKNHLKVIGFSLSQSECTKTIGHYISKIRNHPDKYIFNKKDEEDLFSFHLFDEFEDQFRKIRNLYIPNIESRVYLSKEQSNSYIYNKQLNRWITLNRKIEDNIDLFFSFQPLIKKLTSKEAGNNFVKLLTSIPNFKIKLTEQQKEAVSQTGNVVILGRSGTGKTTCSILRMFAAELFFRFESNNSDSKFSSKDLDKTSVLHSAFLTASPVLTNEVKRYYGRLKEHVRAELERRVEKKDINTQNSEFVKIEEKDEYSSSEDDQEETSAPVSMNLLKDDHFPLFFTVRALIFMIDASLKKPFFNRDLNGKIIVSGANYNWHNEHKGSFKISKRYKNELKKNHEIFDSDSSSDDEFEEIMTKKNIMKRLEKNKKPQKPLKSFEVDFKTFKEKFWPTVKSHSKFSALAVWTEITAYIKGSHNCWFYKGFYLPKLTYANKGQKISLLSKEEKLEIWDLFILYERWKNTNLAYDFQDLVNFILSQIKTYGYNGAPIHYILVDEVQDLTPATISLLMTICTEKIMFSGDTAQTIAKGVAFRFCDLDSLFTEAKVPRPTIKQLTMNFRTHNQILALANSIVSLIETLFPQTIDKMLKETSQVDGPIATNYFFRQP